MVSWLALEEGGEDRERISRSSEEPRQTEEQDDEEGQARTPA
jgi:hypothetical protein